MTQRIIESRNKREGHYAGRNGYYSVTLGRVTPMRNRRVGFSGWLISLRDWSRK